MHRQRIRQVGQREPADLGRLWCRGGGGGSGWFSREKGRGSWGRGKGGQSWEDGGRAMRCVRV